MSTAERTARLGALLAEMGGDWTFTEHQVRERGDLASDAEVAAALHDVVGRLRARHPFRTSLSEAQLVAVVRRFYDGDDDATVAAALGVAPDVVRRARRHLHLFGDGDDPGFDAAAALPLLDAGLDDAAVAADLGVGVAAVRDYRGLLAASREARRDGHRWNAEIESVLAAAGVDIAPDWNTLSDVLSATDEGESVHTSS